MKAFWFWNSSFSPRRWTAKADSPTSGMRLSANSEIAWHYAQALSAEFGLENVVHLSMGDELEVEGGKRVARVHGVPITPDDLCIGHLGPWADQCHQLGLKYIPMVAWPNKMGWPYSRFVYHEFHQGVLDRAPLIISLCGKNVWEASKSDAMLKRWIPKCVPLELGFSRELFPQVKHKFNPPGQRGFLYVGQQSEQKGTGPMIAAFKKLGYPLHIGNGELPRAPGALAPNIHVHGWVDNADEPFWAALAEHVDFMVCPTLWDCQPVSPMECLSRGFPVIGTRWACISGGDWLRDDLSNLEESLRTCQGNPIPYVETLQRAQLAWMESQLRWDPVLVRFREIIRDYLAGNTP